MRHALLVLLAACADVPVQSSHPGLVVEPIDRWIEITEPLPAQVYVEYRAISYAGRIAEYGVRVDDRPLVVSYAIDATSPLPLQTRLYEAGSSIPLLYAHASDTMLELGAGADPLPQVRVEHYADPSASRVDQRAPLAVDTALRPLLDAVLVARPETGAVPAFWHNLDDREPPRDGVAQTSSARRPVLPSWTAPVSLLGALYLQLPCVASESYACPCLELESVATCE